MANTAKFFRHIAQTSPDSLALEVVGSEGIYLHTAQGQRITDLISGVSVSNVGHSNRAVVEAVKAQAEKYLHTMVYGETVMSPQVEFAARLCSFLPPALQSVYFTNSGTEAIEGAIKLARRATGRQGLVSFRRAYHGSTLGALSLMSSPEGDEWRAPFEPLLPDVRWLEFNCVSDLEHITDKTACVVVEPVQGEGGVRLPDDGFLQSVRKKCSETGALLVFDEIQTGMGRTGQLFAFQKYGVVPDILCLAKALGGGMPLGAFVSSREIMGTLSHDPALGHITTFGGHPVCCAAGLAALGVLEGVVEGVEEKGALFESLLSSHPRVREIRRSGLLAAVEINYKLRHRASALHQQRITNYESATRKKPVAFATQKTHNSSLVTHNSQPPILRLMHKFLERGILSDWFLFCDTAFRISPPLTITPAEIRQTCAVIVECLDTL